MIEYKTVQAYSHKELDREVNYLLHEGWQLYGNPYYAIDYREFFQAMTREVYEKI